VDVGQQVRHVQARAFLLEVGAARPELGGQLLVGVHAAGWLLAPPEARLVRPNRIGWQAQRDYAECGDREFLPAELRARRPCPIHAFFALPGSTTDFLYVGEALLSSYGYRSGDAPAEAYLSLRPRVPEEVWLALGGSSGYSVHSATTAIDGLEPDQAEERVRRLIASGDADVWIGDYSERSLTVLVKPDRAFVMLLLEDGAESLMAGEPAAEGDDTPERFTLENGQVDEFERQNTVTHAQAMKCVRSFLRDGSLDPDVRWLE
jgi:Immunity protein Imm1